MVELKIGLKPDMIESIKMSNELERYHSSLGQWMRNQWGLWHDSFLGGELKKKGFSHPDDMSDYLIRAFHRYLNGEPIE